MVLDYRPSSRLLRASWQAGYAEAAVCKQEDFVIDAGRVRPLGGIAAVPCPAGSCNTGVCE